MAYPMEFRLLVAAAYDECGSSLEVAEEYGCSESWVRRLVQRRRDNGSLAPLTPKRPDARKLDAADVEQLRTLIAAKPDMTLATQALGLPLKKRPSTPPSRTART